MQTVTLSVCYTGSGKKIKTAGHVWADLNCLVKWSAEMEYRVLGKTGRKVSVIGLGGEHLDLKPYEQVEETIGAVLEHGVNIIDVFMPGDEIRENIARALGDRRKDVMIQGHIGSTDINQQYDISRDLPTVKKYFENLLRIFGGHIEFGMLFFIDTETHFRDVFETGIAEYAQRLKANGDIGHIGFSSHTPGMAIKVIDTGLPEMMLFPVNPAFDMLPAEENAVEELEKGFVLEMFHGIDPKRAELYKLCEQKQIGITAMKTFAVGKLLFDEFTPFEKALTPAQCIHYALSRPAVGSVLLGCQSENEINEAVKYLSMDDSEKDYAKTLGAMRNDFRGSCVYCNHCQPCPVEIDIASVMKYLDIAKLDEGNIPPQVLAGYRRIAHRGNECVECGNCETRCPFGVQIIDNMAEADRLFG
jgi:predicted aldo/keto reductase-like oxidoreductase